MKTIIYTHPSAASFNHEILNRLSNYFSKYDEDFQLIDLYSDGFNPLMSSDEWDQYGKKQPDDELVKKYQRTIDGSNELVFIFPIWWHNMPAMLKGFLDRVMLNDFAYNEENDWKGLMTYIKKITVITTSTVSRDYLMDACGDPVENVFIKRTLTDMGMNTENANWIHFGNINTSTEEEREEFLNNIPALYKEI